MRIGIIGAGNIGGTLARRLSALGHEVEVANSRGPETLRDLERHSGAKAATIEQVVRDKDLIVLSIPLKNVPKLPQGLFRDVPASTPVVDTCNYYPRERDGRIEAIENGATESAWVAGQIRHATVKAFNNVYADKLMKGGRPKGDPARFALPVSGDDPAQKRIVMDLIDSLGFDPVDNGTLDQSWRYQPGTPGYTSDKNAADLRAALATATPDRLEKFRGTAESPGAFGDPR
jgi:predicted dinucleotide-binding enzyme